MSRKAVNREEYLKQWKQKQEELQRRVAQQTQVMGINTRDTTGQTSGQPSHGTYQPSTQPSKTKAPEVTSQTTTTTTRTTGAITKTRVQVPVPVVTTSTAVPVVTQPITTTRNTGAIPKQKTRIIVSKVPKSVVNTPKVSPTVEQSVTSAISDLRVGASRTPTPQPIQTQQQKGYYITREKDRSDIWQQKYKEWSDVGETDTTIPRGQALTTDELTFFERHGFTFSQMLGQGMFAAVWLCKASQLIRDKSGHFVDAYTACKVISLGFFGRNDPVNQTVVSMLWEGSVLNGLTHENIVLCEDVFYLSQPETGFPFMRCLIFMELCDRSLHRELSAKPGFKMTEKESHQWFVQIAAGLKYLHDRNVVHCDIKPQNIMLKIKPNQEVVYKLCDFGLARMLANYEEMSGNVIQAEIPVDRKIKNLLLVKAADCHSLGSSLAITLAGNMKVNGLLDKCHKRTNYDTCGISEELADLLSNVSLKKPLKPLTIDQIQNHPWFQKY